MSDVSRFLECVNSAQLYSISTGVKVGDVYYADGVQKAFIHTGTGWAQLETTPLRADNISVSPLQFAAADDAKPTKCDCDSHYLRLNTNHGEKLFCKCYVCGREWSKWAVSPLVSIHVAPIPTKIVRW